MRLGARGYWGSDEDLAGDVGMGMDPELLSLTEVCLFVLFVSDEWAVANGVGGGGAAE